MFIKQEQIGGHVHPENVMAMKVRQQPFSINLRWLNPKDLAGQEVAYVAGKNNGALRVHATGIHDARRRRVAGAGTSSSPRRAGTRSTTPASTGLIRKAASGTGQRSHTGRPAWRSARGPRRRPHWSIRVEVVHANDEVARPVLHFPKRDLFRQGDRHPSDTNIARAQQPDGELLESLDFR